MVTPATRPTAYAGIREQNPRETYYRRRDPLSSDNPNYLVGDRWINLATQAAFLMVGKTATAATWLNLGAGGGAGITQLTANFGGAVTPVAGNINLLGDTPTYGLRTSNAGPGSMAIQNVREMGHYVVSAAGDLEYTSIQTAINQAVADGANLSNQKTVWVLPGLYTENLALADGVNVIGFQADGRSLGIIVDGQVTSVGGFTIVERMAFISNVAPSTVSLNGGLSQASVLFSRCNIQNTAVGGVGMLLTGASGSFSLLDRVQVQSDGIAIQEISNSSTSIENSYIIGTTASIELNNGCRSSVANQSFSSGALSGDVVVNDTAILNIFTGYVSGSILANLSSNSTISYSILQSGAAAYQIGALATVTSISNTIESNSGGGNYVIGTGTFNTNTLNTLTGSDTAVIGTITTNTLTLG